MKTTKDKKGAAAGKKGAEPAKKAPRRAPAKRKAPAGFRSTGLKKAPAKKAARKPRPEGEALREAAAAAEGKAVAEKAGRGRAGASARGAAKPAAAKPAAARKGKSAAAPEEAARIEAVNPSSHAARAAAARAASRLAEGEAPAPAPAVGPAVLSASRRIRYEGLPLVVIAGRPNVGKSTLYNRLLHKRRAITDPTPGVTRDPVDAVCELRDSGRRLRLVDTGGFKLDREGLDSLVVEKSLSSLAKADLIVFLVDAMEITPEDEEFAALLRRWSPKVLLVVNKADSPERDPLVWGHAKWGFEPVIFVSAEHGRNIDVLEAAMVARLDFSAVREVESARDEIRVAIMGKPNTGKSTLVNRLLKEEKSIVSDVAGTTRDVVEGRFEHKGRQVVVLDTAGIRRKKKVSEAVEYYSVNRAIRTVDECDVVVLMIDAREGLTEQDKKITSFAVEKGRGVIFALNKWDEMPDLKNSFEAARDKLRYFFGQLAYAPVLPLSAKEGTGVDKLLNMVVTVHAELCREVETSKLNKAVEDWIEATPPPVGPRTRWKLRYAVQTSANPLKFVFFVSKPDAVKEAYVSFLKNKIRDELGFGHVPVALELRASRTDRRKG
ncbi:MAG TPA: ribosome biogenesis GTPase Der [Spirochaetia bacterium]|nr:ribosome biogenesis GTPase Der [Spirochaetia bacterium]